MEVTAHAQVKGGRDDRRKPPTIRQHPHKYSLWKYKSRFRYYNDELGQDSVTN